MPVFFGSELEAVAVFWRIYRLDGVTLALTSHDKPLYFDGISHQSAPGIAPSAIRKTVGFDKESAEVEGALSHTSISKRDLSAGKYDNASIDIGAVNWETLENALLYSGQIGEVKEGVQDFSAGLRSAKQQFERDLVSYTSPTCRADFCGSGCGLSAEKFTRVLRLDNVNHYSNSVSASSLTPALHLGGKLTFLEGPQCGLSFGIIANESTELILDRPMHSDISAGTKVRVREGCDHTHATCHARFANAANFRGEPFLPGNDLLTRYPKPR